MIKKLITYAVIFFMVFHFSVSGVFASGGSEFEGLSDEVHLSIHTNIDNIDEKENESKVPEEETLQTEDFQADLEEDNNLEAESEPESDSESIEDISNEESKEDMLDEKIVDPSEDSNEKDSEKESNHSEDRLKENKEKSEYGSRSKEITSSLELPYKKGDDHKDVIPVKVMLNALGFDGIAETGNYGKHTEKRVKEFQAYYGIDASGEVDQKTLDTLKEIYNSPYQKGNSNSRTTEVKKMLNALGYNGLSSGPVYGSLTETRVKEFQTDYGLKAHGIVDEVTYSQLKAAYNKTEFQQGDNHPGVIPIKQKLNALGFGGLAETGNYGSHTTKRVKEFQKYYGLSSTGIVDKNTQEKLNEVYNSPYQKGKSNQYTTQIKRLLNVLDYNGLSDGPAFGSLTEKRLKQFQKDNGLKAHGIADDKTINKLEGKVLKKGDVSPVITDVKKKLNTLGYNGLATGPVFGSLTEKRLKEFQRDYGLRDYGFADNQTQKKLDSILAAALKKGDKKPEVIDLKRRLNLLGYDGLALTNNFGSLTEKRLKQFQKDNNLLVTGIADPKTLQVLNNSHVTIYIDPGHGGHDSGGSSYGLKEKDVVLDIAKKLAQELRGYAGVEVILSRTTDEYISLSERTKAANDLGVDFFISLHTNAHNGSGNGFESYIYNGSVHKETEKRQEDIHQHIASWLKTNNDINDRGAKSANFHVLRESTMPALLLEYMFIDNKKENNLLKNKSYRDALGKLTADAIAKSFNFTKLK